MDALLHDFTAYPPNSFVRSSSEIDFMRIESDRGEFRHEKGVLIFFRNTGFGHLAEVAASVTDFGLLVFDSLDDLAACELDHGLLFVPDNIEALDKMREARLRYNAAYSFVVYSHEPSIVNAVAALKLGALDYFALPIPDADLRTAVTDAARAHAQSRTQLAPRWEALSRLQNLTPREREVFALVAEGYSNKDIAAHLGISARTVEIHRLKLFAKLNIKSAAHAAKLKILATGHLQMPPSRPLFGNERKSTNLK